MKTSLPGLLKIPMSIMRWMRFVAPSRRLCNICGMSDMRSYGGRVQNAIPSHSNEHASHICLSTARSTLAYLLSHTSHTIHTSHASHTSHPHAPVLVPPHDEVVLKDVQHGLKLAEEHNPVTICLELRKQPIEHLHNKHRAYGMCPGIWHSLSSD